MISDREMKERFENNIGNTLYLTGIQEKYIDLEIPLGDVIENLRAEHGLDNDTIVEIIEKMDEERDYIAKYTLGDDNITEWVDIEVDGIKIELGGE